MDEEHALCASMRLAITEDTQTGVQVIMPVSCTNSQM